MMGKGYFDGAKGLWIVGLLDWVFGAFRGVARFAAYMWEKWMPLCILGLSFVVGAGVIATASRLTTTPDLRSQYDDGLKAGLNGLPVQVNPYSTHHYIAIYEQWSKGWIDAQYKLKGVE